MYVPELFVESDVANLHNLMDQYNFATLYCPRAGEPPEIVHMPFILDRTRGPNGLLLGHVARANPVWRLFDGSMAVVVVFQGPHGYISPAWYTSREQVPTWNYAVAHAHGKPQLLADTEALDFLHRLVAKHEGTAGTAWRMSELSADYLKHMTNQIVVFSMPIDRLIGKFKLSQNRTVPDRRGAIDGLRARGDLFDRALIELMEEALFPSSQRKGGCAEAKRRRKRAGRTGGMFRPN